MLPGGEGSRLSGGGGLEGLVAQVQLSLAGKYGMVFSGNHLSNASHFCMKTGQAREVLGC